VFGHRSDIANLASWVTGTEGSIPSLSAKFNAFSVPLCYPAEVRKITI